MELSTVFLSEEQDELTGLVAERARVAKDMILAFSEFQYFFEQLLRLTYQPGARLISVGHASPEIELAAANAEVQLIEALGVSPFTTDIKQAADKITEPVDLIYVANPNRVTGASCTLADLEELSRSTPRGMLFIDEFFHNYLGVTGLPLIDLFSNVVILRSFVASMERTSCDAGYLLANSQNIRAIKSASPARPMSTTVSKTVADCLSSAQKQSEDLEEMHNEMLRISSSLSVLGVATRLTPTNFMLFRVQDPDRTIDYCARYSVTLDNLTGYPLLKDYVRYRVASDYGNDRLLEAFKNMPEELRGDGSGVRASVTLKRRSEHGRPHTNRLVGTTSGSSNSEQDSEEIETVTSGQ